MIVSCLEDFRGQEISRGEKTPRSSNSKSYKSTAPRSKVPFLGILEHDYTTRKTMYKLLLLLSTAALVSAHGQLKEPAPLSNKFVRIGADCGKGADLAAAKATGNFQAGQEATVKWFILNGDGGGPLQVGFDTTGKGTSFDVKAAITQDAPGQNRKAPKGTTKQAHDVKFTVPADLNCPDTGCVMQIKQAGNGNGFGSCALVNVNGGAGGNAAGEAKAVAAATAEDGAAAAKGKDAAGDAKGKKAAGDAKGKKAKGADKKAAKAKNAAAKKAAAKAKKGAKKDAAAARRFRHRAQ
ncbi:uncharacterized protein SPPG_02581 [Spizellomyces punctatus DAOM BR117]|uniref:Chitin-binding type-4 domain-containing protein n=1 Tax=Spizellomyces punctatus (strain DAOM BR117) TaxID=645134 RepID=A0A0L0HMF1_SPIPD|nr:uncharacterized protein SPPG_02581 [Spizellomyces punctatus DAOM BR117]KND02080.1 hypothetical protein SPPG_02581 [Spizellomyces punctatus DAOM BR117]|eukprot:XP_016610119.1 hypothetical protein SPPG_02581 [Spizellomyces punctatus DAOM BR117]